MSYTATNQDFIQHLSALIVQTVQRSPHSFTENKGSPLCDSRTTDKEDGYFEMGLHEGDQTFEFNTTSDTQSSDSTAVKSIDIVKILWSFSIHIHKGLRQFASCLVLTDDLLAVFEILPQELRGNCQHIPSALKLMLCFPYTDIAEFGFFMPEICLTLKLKNSDNCLLVVSDSQNLQDFYSCLHTCSQCCTSVLRSSTIYCGNANLQEFLCQLMELNCISSEDVEIKGCFLTYLVYGNKTNVQKTLHHPEPAGNNKKWSKNDLCSALYSSTYKSSDQGPCVFHPCWVFLTPQHLYIVKVDFSLLPSKWVGTEEDLRSVLMLNRIPLASVVLHPTHVSVQQKGSFLDGHVLELLIGYRFVTAVFVLPHEKFHFLRIYSLLRTLLQDVKTIVIFKASNKPDGARNHALESNRHGQSAR